ncbi:MAG: protease inhibitor I42 family protein [Bacteroidales bacterium]|nr:protease inhibitor I42 family protein [Bacteroidales bacterium]
MKPGPKILSPKTLVLLLIAMMGLSACKEILLTADQQGKTVQVQQHDVVTLQLRGNPTTGNTWRIEQIDTDMLEQIGDYAYAVDDDKIGSGGMFTFRFKVLKHGESTLALTYKSQHNANNEVLKTFSVRLSAK